MSGEIDWEAWEQEASRIGGFPPFIKWEKNSTSGKRVGYLMPPVREVQTRFGRTNLVCIFGTFSEGKPAVYSMIFSSKRLLRKVLPLLKRVHKDRAIIKVEITWEGVGFFREYDVRELEIDEGEIHKLLEVLKKDYPTVAEMLGIADKELRSPIDVQVEGILSEVKDLLEITPKIPLKKLEEKILKTYPEDAWVVAKEKLVVKNNNVIGVKE